jgi:DNA invertase Pin-like site-specific DNA recombinase
LNTLYRERQMSKRAAIYYRVSTSDQAPDAQIHDLRSYVQTRKFEIVGEYVDTASGVATSRRELDRMLADVRKRKVDVVLVWAFDRFARSTRQLVDTLEEFGELGVDFVSYTQQIDTTTPAGKLTFTVLAAIAEFERELIRERVKAGMAAAKARGKHVGRRRISIAKQNRARRLRADGWPYRRIAKELGVSPGTVVNYVKTTTSSTLVKVED